MAGAEAGDSQDAGGEGNPGGQRADERHSQLAVLFGSLPFSLRERARERAAQERKVAGHRPGLGPEPVCGMGALFLSITAVVCIIRV